MSKNISVGVIGGGARLSGLFRVAKNAGVNLRIGGFCDPDKNVREKFMENFGGDCRTYDDYREMLKDPEISWVMIGSWNSLHSEMAVNSFKAGKNVFCEKPLATNIDDCLAVKNAFEAGGRKLMIGFTLRYSPHYRRIKELVSSGKIGKVVSFEFNETLNFNHGGHIMSCWRRKREFTGCHILEKCCHDFDIANWIIDSRAAKVASFGGLDFFKPENSHHRDRIAKSPEGYPAYSSWPTARNKNPFETDKDIIDNQVCILEYENGVRGTFHTNLNAGIPERRMYILGTEGSIRSDVLKGEIELCKIGFDTKSEFYNTEGTGGHGGGDEILVDHLRKMIEEDAPSLTDLRSGLESAAACFACDDAMLQGRIVELAPYWQKLDI